jgi:gamma-glutamyltranspeptidase/glutathione hydrolase
MRDFQTPGRSAVFSTNGMCATSHPLASKTALDILERGGNAMDAAIAGAVLLGLCEPQSTGIGGDCFVLFSPAGTEQVHALNGSGRAPANASAESLRALGQTKIAETSAHGVTIPGAIDAFCSLSQSWGKLGLPDLLAPAIHYAEHGVPVAPRVAFDWNRENSRLQGSARETYLINGAVPKIGDVFRAPGQAEVLRRIAQDGRDAFYTGDIAQDMVTALANAGGVQTMADFAAAACDVTTPVSGTYKGTELVEHPPNGQGATAILMLNILSHFDLSAMDPMGAQRTHIEAETAKLAYDARNRFIADAGHTTRLDHMLSMETAASLAALINPKKAMANAHKLSENVHKDTVYITVVDKDRMAVSLIYSIYDSFGSGIASDKFGILLHNRGTGFTLSQGHPNELAGNKRPMHTIIPGMMRQNGRVIMPFGVMGGSYQPNGHARFLTNMVDFGFDPQTAIDLPRAYADEGVLKLEKGYSEQTCKELADLGHDIQVQSKPIGGAQAIMIHDNGTLEGASDPRKDGCALGY